MFVASRNRNETMIDRLSAELVDAFENKGNSVKKREDTIKSEANRAFLITGGKMTRKPNYKIIEILV